MSGFEPDGRLGLEVLSWWRYYNRLYLRDALREPVIRIGDSEGRLGSWDPRTRTLGISKAHLADDPWLAVMETLRHEMAHQFALEVLGATDETAHGNAFREACRRLRVSPRASGSSDPVAPPPVEIVDRIAKLLSLSSSSNEHEAQVALKKARQLLLEHNIDAAEVDAERAFSVAWFGPVKGRHQLYEQVLANILNDFFFVSVIWTHTFDVSRAAHGTVLGVYGTRPNLVLAEYVFDYLSSVVETLWAQYRQRNRIPGNRERLRYFAGVLQGFHDKLSAQDAALRKSYALVWKGDPLLDRHVRYHHPHIRTGYSSGTRRSRAYEDGVQEGRSVTLRRPLKGGDGGFGGLLSG